MIEFSCPKCGQHYDLNDSYKGQRRQCLECDALFYIGEVGDGTSGDGLPVAKVYPRRADGSSTFPVPVIAKPATGQTADVTPLAGGEAAGGASPLPVTQGISLAKEASERVNSATVSGGYGGAVPGADGQMAPGMPPASPYGISSDAYRVEGNPAMGAGGCQYGAPSGTPPPMYGGAQPAFGSGFAGGYPPPPAAMQNEYPVLAGKWSRYFARMIDYGLLVFIFYAFLPTLFIIYRPAVELVWKVPVWGITIIMIGVHIFVDSWIYGRFGTTLGKWIMGIRVVDSEGVPLHQERYMERNLQIWLSGMCLGIFLLEEIAFLYQATRLSRGESTTYDTKLGTYAISYGTSSARFTAGIVFWGMLIWVGGSLICVLDKLLALS